nr:hypothetical protein [Clostridia bacterium]
MRSLDSITTDNDFKQRLGDNTLYHMTVYHMTVPSITRLRLVEKAKTLMLERMEERIPLHFEEDRVPCVRIW